MNLLFKGRGTNWRILSWNLNNVISELKWSSKAVVMVMGLKLLRGFKQLHQTNFKEKFTNDQFDHELGNFQLRLGRNLVTLTVAWLPEISQVQTNLKNLSDNVLNNYRFHYNLFVQVLVLKFNHFIFFLYLEIQSIQYVLGWFMIFNEYDHPSTYLTN